MKWKMYYKKDKITAECVNKQNLIQIWLRLYICYSWLYRLNSSIELEVFECILQETGDGTWPEIIEYWIYGVISDLYSFNEQ